MTHSNAPSLSKGNPKGLYILFATEMWERFNYYGMRAILVLFMTKALLFDDVFASSLYGSYTSLVYLTPLVGGYIADRYWGNRRSIIAGGIVMALGELVLFACASTYQSAGHLSTLLFFSGLGMMIAGNGFFKPNISTMVGQLYPKGDRRIDPAYTIFYMGINTGGAIGPFVCGLVGDTKNPADFKWAFLAGGIAMSLSVIVQALFHEKYVRDPDNQVLGLTPPGVSKRAVRTSTVVSALLGFSLLTIVLLYADLNVVGYLTYLLIASPAIIALIIFSDKTITSGQKKQVSVIFIVSFFVIFFWSAFEQAGASLTFFADRQTDRSLNLHVPLWLISLLSSAGLYGTWRLWRSTARSLAGAYHQLLRGVVFFLILALAGSILIGNILLWSRAQHTLFLEEAPASWFQSLNSVFVVSFAPLFAWLWLKLGKWEPSSPTKMAMGLMLLALGYLWISFGVKGVGPGTKVSMIWLTGMYALHTCGELCLSPIGLALTNKLAPVKFASLLMAVWFLANAMANKLAGVLSALYPDKGRVTSFLGYAMKDKYDFFLLFVFMAGTASLILFGLTKKLQVMMQGKS